MDTNRPDDSTTAPLPEPPGPPQPAQDDEDDVRGHLFTGALKERDQA